MYLIALTPLLLQAHLRVGRWWVWRRQLARWRRRWRLAALDAALPGYEGRWNSLYCIPEDFSAHFWSLELSRERSRSLPPKPGFESAASFGGALAPPPSLRCYASITVKSRTDHGGMGCQRRLCSLGLRGDSGAWRCRGLCGSEVKIYPSVLLTAAVACFFDLREDMRCSLENAASPGASCLHAN